MVVRQAIGAYPKTGDSIVPVFYIFGLESSTQIEWVASIMTMNTVFDILHMKNGFPWFCFTEQAVDDDLGVDETLRVLPCKRNLYC